MFGFNGVFGAKPRRFDYRPRYYDLEQEAREQRKRELLGENYQPKEEKPYKPGAYIRDAAMQRRGVERSPAAAGMRARRLVIFFVFIVLAAVWLINTKGIDTFFTAWLTK